LFDKTLDTYSSSTSEGKRSIADNLLPIIDGIDNSIIKEHYLRKLSQSIQTTYESILEELSKKKKKTLEEVTVESIKNKRSREDVLGEYLVALIFQNKDVFQLALVVWEMLSDASMKDRAYLKLIEYYVEFVKQKGDKENFSATLPAEYLDIYNTALLYPLPSFAVDEKNVEEAKKVATQLKLLSVKERIKSLAADIKKKEGEGSEMEELKEEYTRLVGMLKN
jgi:DNA primase